VRSDGLAELGAVVHREVGALAGRQHQMRGVAEKRHAGHPLPPMLGRKGMEHAGDGVGFTVGDERGELSREQIVDAAIALLDEQGENGLT